MRKVQYTVREKWQVADRVWLLVRPFVKSMIASSATIDEVEVANSWERMCASVTWYCLYMFTDHDGGRSRVLLREMTRNSTGIVPRSRPLPVNHLMARTIIHLLVDEINFQGSLINSLRLDLGADAQKFSDDQVRSVIYLIALCFLSTYGRVFLADSEFREGWIKHLDRFKE